jgi:ribosomal protein L29
MAGSYHEQLGEIERQLVDMRLKLSLGRLENTAQIRDLRKKYARIVTAARAEEIAGGLPRGSKLGAVKISKAAGQSTEAAQEPEAKGGFLKGIVDRLQGGSKEKE